MRYLISLGVAALFIGVLTGCLGLTADEPSTVKVIPTDALQTVISPTLISASVAHTEDPVPTETAGWYTYTDLTGLVELEYPVDWSVTQTYSDTVSESSYLKSPSAREYGNLPTEKIWVSVFQIAPEEFADHAPDANVPNDGGYHPYWETPLSVPNANGVLYVVSSDVTCETCEALLIATYFSEVNGLVLTITSSDFPVSANFPVNVRQQAEREGLEATVAEHFPVFDHVMRSVRFVEP